ncbi:MAG: glycerophosphodiester phosphodiesterase [Acidimicrobiia bacterium]|nr:glycerophosphodiester phosphodiesterase [Acidimicrobiia bacterium]NNF63278.1 glycerophosphodiester phosphodiesterase [Acidimicrobiia bacterium]
MAVLSVGCARAANDTSAALTTSSSSAQHSYDLQGHRGARGLSPENTLPSFETALDLGVTTLELDLHLSGDGQVVVWHDPLIDPTKCHTADGEGAPAAIVAETLAAELSQLECDGNPDSQRFPDQSAEPTALAGNNFGIVTLGQLFEFVAAYAESELKTEGQRRNAAAVRFNIETKRVPDKPWAIGDDFDGTTAGRFELAILDLLDQHGVGERTTVQSFDHRSLWAIHAVAPTQELAALTRSGDIPDFTALAEQGATTWAPAFGSITRDRVAAAHEAGLLVVPWTVNETDEMRVLLDSGVDGIITDRPDLAPPSQ